MRRTQGFSCIPYNNAIPPSSSGSVWLQLETLIARSFEGTSVAVHIILSFGCDISVEVAVSPNLSKAVMTSYPCYPPGTLAIFDFTTGTLNRKRLASVSALTVFFNPPAPRSLFSPLPCAAFFSFFLPVLRLYVYRVHGLWSGICSARVSQPFRILTMPFRRLDMHQSCALVRIHFPM